jgi:DNA sulfur modification protein DndC
MNAAVARIISEIQEIYRSDAIPWIVGYSGGKDSTASLQLIWNAVSALPQHERTKTIYVISTDTLVENPVIAAWVTASLDQINDAAAAQGLPFRSERLVPSLENRFWVNLIGKGYPAPRPKFRWCTDRLKISASTEFIQRMSESHSEAILVLGQRRGESQRRDRTMDQYQTSTRARLSKNRDPRLSRVWVYLPIEDWTSDDVWEYLITEPNPWMISNQDLFDIYRGATPDAECPIVVDASTPSCGDSRFGCYVCTMVTQDKSMQAMVQNDDQKQWMKPILEFRNDHLAGDDRDLRDFRRMNGRLTVFRGQLVHGPYKQSHRAKLLAELLRTQRVVQAAGAAQRAGNIELISLAEIEEIRRLWVVEKGEIEDLVPAIYADALGAPYPGAELELPPLDSQDLALLQEASLAVDETAHDELYRLSRNLIAAQFRSQTGSKRSSHLDVLEGILKQHAFRNEAEALEFALSTHQESISDDDATDEPSLNA